MKQVWTQILSASWKPFMYFFSDRLYDFSFQKKSKYQVNEIRKGDI
jgi:hypothetical protein